MFQPITVARKLKLRKTLIQLQTLNAAALSKAITTLAPDRLWGSNAWMDLFRILKRKIREKLFPLVATRRKNYINLQLLKTDLMSHNTEYEI